MTDKEKEDALDDLMDEFNEGGRVQAKDGGPKSKLKPIQKLLKNTGFQLISVEKDISDIPRCIVTKRI